MFDIRGTPVAINGRSTGSPTIDNPGSAPATPNALQVKIPPPQGRRRPGSPIQPATTYARYVRIRNLDASNAMQVWFMDNAGVNAGFVTVKAASEEEFAGLITTLTVQGQGGVVQWEAFATVAS